MAELEKRLSEKEINELTIKLIRGEVPPEEYAQRVLKEDGAGFNFEKMLGKYSYR